MITKSKFKLRRLIDVVLLMVLGWVLYQKFPLFTHGFKQEGKQVEAFEVIALDGQITPVLTKDRKSILVFWATWCPPCHQQLKMFKEAVLAGELPADQITAISIGEDIATVSSFQQKQSYPFNVLASPDLALPEALHVQATPTTVFIENGSIKYFTSGFSPLIIRRSKSFLAEK